jgi:tRNA modification GTPase
VGASYLDSDRLQETIVAVATAAGSGAIGIVRLSGACALDIAAASFSKPSRISDAPSHTAHVGVVVSPSGEQIDQVLALVMRAPNSYTGEHIVEFQAHGGQVQSERVMKACVEAGAVPALAGEFTFRAFYYGKIDLTQAEAVADLIGARTDAAARVALQASGGMLRVSLEHARVELLELRARCEASIDFVDDDIPQNEAPVLLRLIGSVTSRLRRLIDSYDLGRLLRDGARVVLVGAPNVGKSSLFNAILKNDRAIVTDIPGTTRDTLTETIDFDGVPVILADTAGMRDSGGEIEREGMKRSLAYRDQADLILEVVDVSRETSKVAHSDDRLLRIGNKMDLLSDETCAAGSSRDIDCYVSAIDGSGVSDLCEVIARRLKGKVSSFDEVAVSRQRHYEGLVLSLSSLGRARANIESSEPLEVIALELRAACTAIDEVVGTVYNDEVLNQIFGEFCVGK